MEENEELTGCGTYVPFSASSLAWHRGTSVHHDVIKMAAKKKLPSTPTIHVIAGPNGSGKTTFARTFLPEMGCEQFLNADLIAAGLSPLSPTAGAIRAARILLAEWKSLVKAGGDFAFESTLSGKVYVTRLSQAREMGFRIHVYYLWLPSVTVALRRIKQRVTKGGHNVPAGDVKRRFRPSLENFFRLYLPLANEAMLFDGSTHPPKLVAEFRKQRHFIKDAKTYEKITKTIQAD